MDQKAHNAAALVRRKAYSYLRFSTPEQSKGDSYRRQTVMAQAYAQQHLLDLDDKLTFHDLGMSGYRGKNATEGRLGYFREAVSCGLVPQGSVLLVEQLDRLSRMTPLKAIRVLEDIVEAGVSVVTLNDGREYTAETIHTDQIALLVTLLTFMRANEESATKAKRLAAAWGAKRAYAASKPLTGIVPAWLRLDHEASQIVIRPERAAIVQRIFDMAVAGVGQHKIAETLNREGIPTWGTNGRQGAQWHRSYIAKILANPAVIGRMIPHRIDHDGGTKRRVPMEAVEGYFPIVISRETWDDVQALQASKGAARGRQAAVPISNILARLAKCPACGKTMTRAQKGARSVPVFVCTGAKAGVGCPYKSVRYSAVEDRLVAVLPGIIRDREGLEQVEALEVRIANLEAAIPDLDATIEDALDLLLEQRSPALQDRLRRLEQERDSCRDELSALQEHRNIMIGPLVGSRIDRAITSLQPREGSELDRGEVNLALRGLFKRAVINWPAGTVDLEWQLGGVCRVHYAWTAGPWPAEAETVLPVQ